MTLNDAALYTKRFIAYLVIFIILYIIGEWSFKLSATFFDTFFKKPQDPPSIIYGKIPKLNISTLPIDLSKVEFRKELPTVEFPAFPKSVFVYKLEEPLATVVNEENMKDVAIKIGFLENAKKLSNSKRIWVDTKNNRYLESEVFLQVFKYSTDPSFLEKTLLKSPISPTAAIDSTKDYFSSIGFYQTDFEKGDIVVRGGLLQEGLIKETKIPQNEKIKFVGLTPKKLGFNTYTQEIKNGKKTLVETPNYLEVFFRDPTKSNVNTFVGKTNTSGNTGLSVVGASYIYYKTSATGGTYPLIPVEKAYQELLNKNTSLVFIKEDGADFFAQSEAIKDVLKIDIRNISLTYYMPNEFVKYLQPIYVFYGKFITLDDKRGDVYFYLPAIDSQTLID
ncbi:hypothetical protein KA001_02565 [Patescibacteria group bacterium]|nr:hypothetical protein [Patescibacteria group bacterium]